MSRLNIAMTKKRMFLPLNATAKQVAEYDSALRMANAENDMLMAAQKFLEAHGYTIKFKHKRGNKE